MKGVSEGEQAQAGNFVTTGRQVRSGRSKTTGEVSINTKVINHVLRENRKERRSESRDQAMTTKYS